MAKMVAAYPQRNDSGLIDRAMRFAGFGNERLSVGSAGSHLRHARAAGVLATTGNVVAVAAPTLNSHDEAVLDAVMDEMALDAHGLTQGSAERLPVTTVELTDYAADLLLAHERQAELVGAASG